MTETKTFRLPKRLVDAMERDFKQQGMDSMNKWAVSAFEHFLVCKDGMSASQMRLIVLQYDATCKRCSGHIPAGNWALYGRGAGAICMDCYVERIGDKALVAKYLKMREYKQIIKALSIEAERLASKVELGKIAEYIEEMKEKSTVIYVKLMDYFRALGNPNEKQELEELLRVTKEQDKTIELVNNFFERHLKKKKERVLS